MSESAVRYVNTRLVTDAVVDFMQLQQKGWVLDVVLHQKYPVLALVVPLQLVKECSNGKDLLEKAV